MKVLSIDDSSMVRKIISGATELLGYQLLEAGNGLEGLEVLKEQSDVGLILLDWNMPGMNGYEFLTTIKKDHRYKHIPVMMVTTESERESIVKAIQAGASHYLIKPFTMEDLVKTILECLGKGD